MAKYPEAAKGSGYRRNALNCKDARKARRSEKRRDDSMGARARERERRKKSPDNSGDVLCACLAAVVVVASASVLVNYAF